MQEKLIAAILPGNGKDAEEKASVTAEDQMQRNSRSRGSSRRNSTSGRSSTSSSNGRGRSLERTQRSPSQREDSPTRKRWRKANTKEMKAREVQRKKRKEKDAARERIALKALCKMKSDKWTPAGEFREWDFTQSLPTVAQLTVFAKKTFPDDRVNSGQCSAALRTVRREMKTKNMNPAEYIDSFTQASEGTRRRLVGIDLTTLTSDQRNLVDKVSRGRRLTEQELPRSYLHTAEEVLARRRLIHGVQTPPTLAALLREIEEQD